MHVRLHTVRAMSYYDLLGVVPGQFMAVQRGTTTTTPTSALTDSSSSTLETPTKKAAQPDSDRQANTRRQRKHQRLSASANFRKRHATSPKYKHYKLRSSLRNDNVAHDGLLIHQRMEEKWAIYSDVLRPRQYSVDDSEDRHKRQTQHSKKKVFIQKVHGRTELENVQGIKEMCVLVQWNEMRTNGNIMEWVAESEMEGMMGGLEGVQEYHWNRNPGRTNRPVLPPTRRMEGNPLVDELASKPSLTVPPTDGLKISGNSSPRYMVATAKCTTGSSGDAGVEYEMARDLMRLRRRQGGIIPKGT